MNWPTSLDLRQRFDMTVFAVMAMAGGLLLLLLNGVVAQFATDYTDRYWQDYTHTFSNSVKYSVIMRSASGSQDIARNFAADKTVLKASIYTNQPQLLATAGKNVQCQAQASPVTRAYYSETAHYWCFYAPVQQEINPIGHVELVVSKAELESVLQRIRWLSGVMVLAILVILYFVVQRFSSRFTLTMVELSAVLKNVAQGITGQRVTFSGHSDMAMMGATFNTMLAQIELNERELEQKIAEKTQALAQALENSEAANRYKSSIMATVSHEMKTPLHAIGAYLELTANSWPENDAYDASRDFHRRALIRVGDLNDLIGNILLHGKLNTHRVEAAQLPVAIEPLMQACAEKLAPGLDRNQNRLQFSGPALSVVSDADLLTHIINNILSNACKFTSAGEISLNWWMEASTLVIQVSDTGCGIPEACYDQIFESFWQVDMTSTRPYGGTGLGLAITKQCVELLKGEISVGANGDRGSVFTVKIPNG